MTIRDRLYIEDPYLDFPVRESQVRGWNSEHPKLAELIQEIQPKLILELGSWLGASALFMAKYTDAEIVCVDTFTGAAEFWTDKMDPERYQALRIEHGMPTVYRDFMSNVIAAGKQHQITPLPVSSLVGMEMFDRWGISPDLIYLDSSHSAESVGSDIRSALSLNPKVLCGDDYCPAWPGLVYAVDWELPWRNVETDSFWWFKPSYAE